MERMLAVMAANPLAAGAGLMAMACFAAWPLFHARWAMLATYIGNNLGFVVHYACLGHWTAVAMNGLMGIQTLAAIWLVRWPRLRWVYFAFIPMLGVMSLVTWQGLPSLLSAVAITFSTIGRLQSNEIALRILLLCSTPFWLAHDLIVGSLPGLAADILSMIIGAAMLLRAPAVRIHLSKIARFIPSGQHP